MRCCGDFICKCVFVRLWEKQCVCEAGVCNHRRAELRGNRAALHLSVRVPVCSRPIRIMWIIAGYVDCVNVEIEFVYACLCVSR